jgi:glycine cleavage system aminomethyltransferase T
VMGPRSRELLGHICETDLSNDGFPFFTARSVQVGSAPAIAIRASYVGELGWELHVPTEFAVHVHDAVVDAGLDLGLRHAGYHALDSLRIEKRFVHVGHDVGPRDDPFTAGLEHVVKLEKDFVGADALRRREPSAPASRLVSVRLEDPEPMLFHGESVLVDDRVVGTVMSGTYAHTLGSAAGLAIVDGSLLHDGRSAVEVDVAGTPVKATLSSEPLYDPAGSRMRS